jgi:hypothetical protein
MLAVKGQAVARGAPPIRSTLTVKPIRAEIVAAADAEIHRGEALAL